MVDSSNSQYGNAPVLGAPANVVTPATQIVMKNFTFVPEVAKVDMSKRRVLSQLPMVHQTSTLTKFFAATVDHLFDPGESVALNGYIGQKPGYSDPEKDFYIKEENAIRQNYQLEVGMTTNDTEQVDTLLFYQDLINHLRFQGAYTDNHNRLFAQEYYTWCPPINLDMFLNFRKYYWIPQGPTPIDIYGPRARAVGDGVNKKFHFAILPGTTDPLVPAALTFIRVKVDGREVAYTWNVGENFVTLAKAPNKKAVVEVWANTDFNQNIIGYAEPQGTDLFNGPQLTSGLRIRINNDIDSTLNGKIFIVEGVGRKIVLLPDDSPNLEADPEFITMERNCRDGNPWSRGNRWFHQDCLNGEEIGIKAKRPIIEFAKDLKLYNYGNLRRGDVDLVDSVSTDFLGNLSARREGAQPIDGVNVTIEWVNSLPGGVARILTTKDRNPLLVNRIFLIRVVNDLLQVSLEADGFDPSGAPHEGETIKILHGQNFGDKEFYWNSFEWLVAQTKTRINQLPLFQLYDNEQIPLDDAGVYPNSNFGGDPLFTYKVGSEGKDDKYLGFPLVHSKNGDIVFNNTISINRYSYNTDIDKKEINGLYWCAFTQEDGGLTYDNGWHPVVDSHGNRLASKQYVVDKFTAQNGWRLYSLSQEPNSYDDAGIQVNINNVKKEYMTDYLIQGKEILFNNINDGDFIEIRTYNNEALDEEATGYYEIPENLQSNPLSGEITEVTKASVYAQFSEIMSKQTGFKGNVYDQNNWRDTVQKRNLGSSILQHSATLPRLMLHCARRDLDIPTAIRYADEEYARFRSKFEQKIAEYIALNRFSITEEPSVWVDAALQDLNKGKTTEFPFAYSGMGILPDAVMKYTFIPPTPSWLGLYPLYQPRKYLDTTLRDPQWVIQGHDGSIVPAWGETDIRDDITLELENRIYLSAPEQFKSDWRPLVDFKKYVDSAVVVKEYRRKEYLALIRSSFEKWCAVNQITYRDNKTWDVDDPWTWNWSTCHDVMGTALPGHWRAIYEYYYDTDRPHTHPWEMLGFTQEPDWWVERYGSAPYTSENVIMWQDIKIGRIVEGPRAGLHTEWFRGESFHIPVDDQGNLLNPYQARIATTTPTITDLQKSWEYGDGGPAELAWKRSSAYPYAVALASYLMKPAMWVETNWDTTSMVTVMAHQENAQMIDVTTGRRPQFSTMHVHGEIDNNGVLHKVVGYQQWISDVLKSKNMDLTDNFGRLVRSLNVQLCYKVAGFTDNNNLVVVSDSFDRMPTEDVNVALYRSPSVQEVFYGGVIVEWTGKGWRVYGYDIQNPKFTIYPADLNGNRAPVTVSDSPTVVVQEWRENTYYNVNITVKRTNTYYRCIKTHTSGRSFDEQFWVEVAKPQTSDPNAVVVYTEYFADRPQTVLYGSTFNTKQEVADFLIGWGHRLTDMGWVFDYINIDTNTTSDWVQAVREFLSWSQFDWEPGTFLSLSPGAEQLRFTTETKAIQQVDDVINGTYSVLNKAGLPIEIKSLNILRTDGDITITSRNTDVGVYACRLYLSEIEHALVFNNKTIFDDVVYDPLFGIRQIRLRLQGYKTSNWKGRIDAPGFFMSGNVIRPNFEKSATDFRGYFEVEGIENTDLRERARHNIGYQERSYLNDLLLTPTNQFEFYQGMIQHKGTPAVLRRLLRSNFIRHGEDVQFLEEWGFKVGDFGSQGTNLETSFNIKQSDIQTNPQMFEFNSYNTRDLMVDTVQTVSGVHNRYSTYESLDLHISIAGIKAINVINHGSGYTSTPKVTFTGGDGSGLKAKAIMDWSSSVIQYINIVDGGRGYLPGDMIIINGRGDNAGHTVKHENINWMTSLVDSITVINGGTGYVVGDQITITGGNGTARAEVATVGENGRILTVKITQRGSGYDHTTTAHTVRNPNGCTLKVNVTGGSLKLGRLILDSAGSGYDDTTKVTFISNSKGDGAKATAVVSGGNVSEVEILDPGTGYTIAPTVTFTGSKLSSQALATAVLDTEPFHQSYVLFDLKDFNLINIERVILDVVTPFNGAQPTISIGYEQDKQAYLKKVTLTKQTVLRFDDVKPNVSDEIVLYFYNTNTIGNVKVNVRYNLTDEHYAQYVSDHERTQIVSLSDIFHDEGSWAWRNPRWVWRHQTKELDWPVKHYGLVERNFLPNAGYVHLDDVQWYDSNWDSFEAKYAELYNTNTPDPSTQTLKIALYSNSFTKLIVPTMRNGTARIRKIVVEVTRQFLNSTNSTIRVGSKNNPSKWATSTQFNLGVVGKQTKYIYENIQYSPDVDNGIYLNYTCDGTNMDGEASVTVYYDVYKGSIMSDDRCWVYDTGAGNWNVYTLKDTTINVVNAIPPTNVNQGTIVIVDKSLFDTASWIHWSQQYGDTTESRQNYADWFGKRLVIVNGCELNGTPLDLVYNPIMRNEIRTEFVQNGKNGVAQDIEQRLLTLLSGTGITIERVQVNVLSPFQTGTQPSISIGTTTNPEMLMKRFSSYDLSPAEYNPSAPRPYFNYGQPIDVSIYNGHIYSNEPDAGQTSVFAPIEVVRSGNIYLTPSNFTIVRRGSGYTTAPNITVTGPEGVTAAASMAGPIKQIFVTNGGSGYTTPPTVIVMGGGNNATGATALAQILDGKVVSVTVTNGGDGYSVAPTIVFSGGNGTGATALANIDYGVDAVQITSIGRCNYNGSTPPVVTVDPPDDPNGEQAEIILNFEPNVPPVTRVYQWRYREYGTADWTVVGGLTDDTAALVYQFDSNAPNGHWTQTLYMPLPANVDGDVDYEIEIPITRTDGEANIVNGYLGNRYSTVTVINNRTTNSTADLTTIGSYVNDVNWSPTGDDGLNVYINHNNPTNYTTPDPSINTQPGRIEVVVNYHYSLGFELFKLDKVPAKISDMGFGGDVLEWCSSRFAEIAQRDAVENLPINGWDTGDHAWVDNGLSVMELAKPWDPTKSYDLYELVKHNGQVYRSTKGGKHAIAKLSTDSNGSILGVDILDYGTMRTTQPTVTLTGGTGAVLNVLLEPTTIKKISIIDGGEGYNIWDEVNIVGGNGQDAVARINRVNPFNGAIVEMLIINNGSGYTEQPHVQINGGTKQAVLEVLLEPTKIDRIEIVQSGLGYVDDSDAIISNTTTTTTLFVDGEWELTMEKQSLWRVFQYHESTNTWFTKREQETKVNTSYFESANIYNMRDKNIEQTLQMYDPYKGIIPGIVQRELKHILPYDPAFYTYSEDESCLVDVERAWGPEQIGRLWWDISTVKYLDYEQGSDTYRSTNWGRLCPGVYVDVYEWVRSTVQPADWLLKQSEITNTDSSTNARTSGRVKSRTAWVMRQEWNPYLNRNETVYYFWVRNLETVPAIEGRNLSSSQIISILSNMSDSGIAWFAPIDKNKVIVSGVHSYLNDYDSVIRFKWRLNHYEGTEHKQWLIIKEEDERRSIDTRLWSQMRNSLLGWVSHSENTYVYGVLSENVTIQDQDYLELEDASQFTHSGIIRINGVLLSYKYKWGNKLHGVSKGLYPGMLAGLTITQERTQNYTDPVPAPWLSETESYGNMIRPRQSWFKKERDSRNHIVGNRKARRAFIEKLNEILARQPIVDQQHEWYDVFVAEHAMPADISYSYKLDDIGIRNDLKNAGLINPGERVLIPGSTETNGFWTVWEYVPGQPTADGSEFLLVDAQKWRLQGGELWNYKDWYASDWTSEDFPLYRFATKLDRDRAAKIDVTLLKGTLVHVDRISDNDPRWAWYVYNNNGWVEVAKQDATIELSSAFYDTTRNLYGVYDFNMDDIKLRDGSYEMAWLLDNLYEKVLTNQERNELFFAMINTVFVQHENVDWVFKTSFLSMNGLREKLGQSPVAQKDHTQSMVDYITEVKPYHVKVREIIRSLSPDVDTSYWNVTDFDRPLYFDSLLNKYRKVDHNGSPDDRYVYQNLRPWKDWYSNYQNTNYDLELYDVDWNPVRRLTTTIVFDRVSCGSSDESLNRPDMDGNTVDLPGDERGWAVQALPWDSGDVRTIGMGPESNYYTLLNTYQAWPPTASDYTIQTVATIVERDALNNLPDGQIVVVQGTNGMSIWRWEDAAWKLFEYRQIVVNKEVEIDDLARQNTKNVADGLKPVLQTGDTAYVTSEQRHYIWTGDHWENLWGIEWDLTTNGGAVDRIDKYYVQASTSQKAKDRYALIRGCEFGGTILNGGEFEYGIWDMFPWDYEGGWANEFDDFVGRDVDIEDRGFTAGEIALPYTDSDQDGILEVPLGYRPPTDASQVIVLDDAYDPETIIADGNEFAQPWFDSCRPDEQVKFRSRSPMMLTVKQKATTAGAPANHLVTNFDTAFRMFQSGLGHWEMVRLMPDDLQLAEDLTAYSKTVKVKWVGAGTPPVGALHDPKNPSQMFKDNIKLSVMNWVSTLPESQQEGYIQNLLGLANTTWDDLSDAQKDDFNTKLAAVNLPGVIWINHERVTYWSISYDSATKTYTLGDVNLPVKRGTGTTSSASPLKLDFTTYKGDGVTASFAIDPAFQTKAQFFVRELKYIQRGTTYLPWYWETKQVGVDYNIVRDGSGNAVSVDFIAGREPAVAPTLANSVTDWKGGTKTYTAAQLEDMRHNVRIEAVLDDWTNPANAAHLAGSVVYDGSSQHWLPMNHVDLKHYPDNMSGTVFNQTTTTSGGRGWAGGEHYEIRKAWHDFLNKPPYT